MKKLLNHICFLAFCAATVVIYSGRILFEKITLRHVYSFMLIIAFIAFAVPMYALAVDSSSNAQLASHLLTNLYHQYAPTGNTYVGLFFTILAGVGIPMLAKFQAELKADPTKQPVAGVTGWLLNVLTFFVDNVESADPNLKKN